MRAESAVKAGLSRPRLGCALLAAAVVLGVAPTRGWAQEMPGMEASGLKAPLENYPPPNETQVKTLLEGAEVKPLQGGLVQLTDVQLKTFSTNGALQMLIQSPQCVFDTTRRTVHSAGPLRMRTADRHFFIEGRGFRWDEAQSKLVLSNRVHTTVQENVLAAKTAPEHKAIQQPGANSNNIEVFSDWFEYERDRGVALYRGHVRVTGTNLMLTADSLMLAMQAGGGPLESIRLRGNVVMNRGELHATGDEAVYTATNNVIVITGNPSWRVGQREGRGDVLVVDRAKSVLHANGHGSLRVPLTGTSAGLGLNPMPAAGRSSQATNGYIQIASDSYELTTNQAVFRDRVHCAEHGRRYRQGTLDCGRLTVYFSGTNQIRQMIARDQVVLKQRTGQITSGRAVFSGTNSVVAFHDHPAWQLGARKGSGDTVFLDQVRGALKAVGHARIELPANQVRVMAMSPPSASSVTRQSDAENEAAVTITCDQYDLTQDLSVFRGRVRVRNPRGQLDCDLLKIRLAHKGGETSREARAERQRHRVQIIWVDSSQRTNYAWSNQAVYSYSVTNSVTNELVTLTGNPVVTNPQGTYTGDRIVWDRIHGNIFAANERSLMRPGATNSLQSVRDPFGVNTNSTKPEEDKGLQKILSPKAEAMKPRFRMDSN